MPKRRGFGFGWALPPLAVALGGCDYVLMDPRGQVGMSERDLILGSTGWMLLVVLPAIVMAIWFAWWFRASNRRARYAPDWHRSNRLEAVVWGVPALIVVAMGITAWRSTHALDPFRPLDHPAKHLEIQVVALDWKWLFIYPEQGVASVNEVAIPVGVPVAFSVTSDTVMNSFFIPQLGSQIYAMGGMRSKVHLIADVAGDYRGMSSQFSGRGFSGMTFRVLAEPEAGFSRWVERTRSVQRHLDGESFAALAEPSVRHPVEHFGTVAPGLFDAILQKYHAGPDHQAEAHGDVR